MADSSTLIVGGILSALLGIIFLSKGTTKTGLVLIAIGVILSVLSFFY